MIIINHPDKFQFKEDITMGILYAIIAGATMSIQGVMNTRLGEKIGLFEANAFMQGTAFALSMIVALAAGKGSFSGIMSANKLYLFGGVLAMVITVTVMLGMGRLTPATAVSVILIAQLLVAAVIDAFGLMGTEKVPFTWNKYAGLLVMISGMLLFKWDGKM